jgi:predicted lactoylglutathione lyase
MMSKFVFINLSTKNVTAAREFYTQIGFAINKDFSSEENVFVTLSENVQLILCHEDFLRQLGEKREFADATKVTEGSVAISLGSREEVDTLYNAAIAAGAKPAGDQEEKEIGLYARAFFDLDGHKIDVNYMPAQ